MRSIDLALYADALAAEASALAARLERARGRLRRAAIEREARQTLGAETVERLQRLELLGNDDPDRERAEVSDLTESIAALEELQAWVEERLFVAREEGCTVPD
jgi:hypothetical protein